MKKKFLLLIIAIVIVGLVMGIVKGFTYGLFYSNNEKIEIALEQNINKNEMKEIANKVFESSKYKIQMIELFGDTVAITVPSSTDEQIQKLVELVNEKYSLEYTKENVKIVKVPQIKGADIIKKYITPAIISLVIIGIYMAIRYWKLGAIKVVIKTICYVVITEGLLASIYTIGSLPVNDYTMPIALLVFGLTIFTTSLCFEKELKSSKEKEEEDLLKE